MHGLIPALDSKSMPVPVPPAPPTLRGYSLAHQDLTAAERAFLAVDIFRGDVLLAPTLGQAAMLADIGRTYAFAALRASTEERRDVLAGRRSLHSLRSGGELVALVKSIGADAWLNAGIEAGF